MCYMGSFINALRTTKRHLLIRNITKKPVIIMASRRGGSTLVADIVSSQRGVWISNEPFAVLPYHPGYDLKRRLLPKREHTQFFALVNSELEQFQSYVFGLLNAQHRSLGTCINTKFPLITDRVCLKILNTPWMLEWFTKNTNADIIFLTRHPGSQAVSVLRQGWEFAVKVYFSRPDLLENIFSEKQINLGFDILKRGNVWEIAILDWIVCTHHGRTSNNPDLIKTTYENIVMEPEWFINNIMVNKFGFTETEKMRRIFNMPSGSSRMSTNNSIKAIQADNKSELLSLWRKKVDDKKIQEAQNILDQFDINSYSMYDNMPLISQEQYD